MADTVSKTHHVVSSPTGGWGVKRGGASRVARRFDSKQDAESYAREVSQREQTELVIHHRDGTIQSKVAFNDARAPRDTP